MLVWLKDRWGYVAVMVGVVLAFFAGRGLTRREVKSALALRKLTDATQSHAEAERRASELKRRSDALAEELLAEELALAAEKDKANALSPDAVVLDLRRRRIIK